MSQERKVVTVLFADIVDSSASSRAYDAEVVRSALARTFARARQILVDHGGTVEKFIGDAVMAVFGLPVTHEDDAERAVRAAIELRSMTVAGSPNDGPAFMFRIGINTGEVVAGDGQGGEFLVTGAPVVVAARLEQSATAGEILVGQLTRELTAKRVTYGVPRPIAAKGIGMVEAAPAVEVVRQGSRRPAAGPFVDREAELQLLLELRTRVVATGRPHLVTIFGDAGIGKSRLANELMSKPESAPAVKVACLPYGHAITYWPLQELIRAEAGITPVDGRDLARAKIEAAVARALGGDEEVERAVGQQLASLALAEQQDSPSDLTSEERRHELARAIRTFLEARLRQSPATIVLEDLHWAEEPLLELIEELLDQLRGPLFLVCLARRELLDRRPTWGSGHTNALALTLEPLSASDSERLARELLDGVDGGAREIATRTEGNPLFVEEYVRMLVDHGADAVVPPTLHGVIAARLDATAPSVKRLLQEASVLGRDFWLDALPGHAQEPRHADIAEAERRDLVAQSDGRGPSGSQTYRFKHGLIRDVAYASLSKAERIRVHDHYARWLEPAAGERGQEYAEIIAYHAQRAFELAREVDPPAADELGRRAFSLLCASGSAAWARADFRIALKVYDRALAVAQAIGMGGPERIGAQVMAAIARLRLEADAGAIAELDAAIEAARALGANEHLVRLLIWRASSVTIFDDVIASRALFAEAVSVARQMGDPSMIAYAVWASSEPEGVIGQLDDQARLLEEALAHMRTTGIEQWLVSCLSEISANALERGDLGRAQASAEEALVMSRETGRRLDRFKAADAFARCLLATDDSQADAAAEDALSLAREIGGPWALARATETASVARAQRGDLESARAALDEALGMLDPARMPIQREAIARLEAIRSRLALVRGDLEEARQSAETAVRVAPVRHVAARAIAVEAAAGVALVDGRRDEARRLVEQALAILGPTGHRTLRDRIAQLRARVAAPVA